MKVVELETYCTGWWNPLKGQIHSGMNCPFLSILNTHMHFLHETVVKYIYFTVRVRSPLYVHSMSTVGHFLECVNSVVSYSFNTKQDETSHIIIFFFFFFLHHLDFPLAPFTHIIHFSFFKNKFPVFTVFSSPLLNQAESIFFFVCVLKKTQKLTGRKGIRCLARVYTCQYCDREI